LVISCARYNETAEDIVAMIITTTERHATRSGAVVIDNWRECGLNEPSVVKPVIFSYDADLLTYVGEIDPAAKQKVKEALREIFTSGPRSTAPAPRS
jgi:PemK-like, MazF-like toxin of type II toxin-antitoxin system